jgi:hypothetical protein
MSALGRSRPTGVIRPFSTCASTTGPIDLQADGTSSQPLPARPAAGDGTPALA